MAKSLKGSGKKAGQSAVGTTKDSDLSQIEKILSLMTKHEVGEFEWERPGEKIKLKSRHYSAQPVMEMVSRHQERVVLPAQPAPAVAAAPALASKDNGAAAPAKPVGPAANQKQILSPFVGTFYRSASPTSAPYVKEGQAVKRGDTLCIVEAMKLMNGIESEYSCKVVSVLVENGQPVEFGEPLFLVEA